MRELINREDKYKMNWIEGSTERGTVKAPDGLEVSVSSRQEANIVIETYRFTNKTDRDIFTSLRDISIYTPFQDDYPDAGTCMTITVYSRIIICTKQPYAIGTAIGLAGGECTAIPFPITGAHSRQMFIPIMPL